jgi:hypothetical protein
MAWNTKERTKKFLLASSAEELDQALIAPAKRCKPAECLFNVDGIPVDAYHLCDNVNVPLEFLSL